MRQNTATDHQRNTYDSFKAMCRHYDKTDKMVSCRLDLGWSLEKALTTPTMSPYRTDKYLNKENVMKCGMKCKIITYRRYHDIDVQFEDGTIVQHTYVSSFNNGTIAHPLLIGQSLKDTIDKKQQGHVGEIVVNKQGIPVTLIAYRTCSDIDLQFPNGTTKEHALYQYFKNGLYQQHEKPEDHIGETHLHKNGETIMEIIHWNNPMDIDIKLPKGEILKKKRYDMFLKGAVKLPTTYRNTNGVIRQQKFMQERQGQTFNSRYNIPCTITNYQDAWNVEVLFDDGYTGVFPMKIIKQNDCVQPIFKHNQFKNESKYLSFQILNRKYAKNEIFMECYCEKCKLHDTLTPSECLEHYKTCSKTTQVKQLS